VRRFIWLIIKNRLQFCGFIIPARHEAALILSDFMAFKTRRFFRCLVCLFPLVAAGAPLSSLKTLNVDRLA
jgi:hypothetical protein